MAQTEVGWFHSEEQVSFGILAAKWIHTKIYVCTYMYKPERGVYRIDKPIYQVFERKKERKEREEEALSRVRTAEFPFRKTCTLTSLSPRPLFTALDDCITSTQIKWVW